MLKYNLQFVSNYELPHTNKNNLHSHSPYFYDYDNNCYVVDQQWFSSLTESVQTQLKAKFNIGAIKPIEYPHQVNKAYEYWEIYTWYNCDLYDFQRYIDDIADINQEHIHLVKFADNKERTEFSQLFFKQNAKIDSMQRLNTELQYVLTQNKIQKGYFVKLTQRSAKNEIKLFPAKTIKQVYDNLIYSNDVKKEIYQSSGILMREWKNFEHCIQFRVLIFNKRIIGISPQFYQQKMDWKTINFGKFINQLETQIDKVRFANSFTLDVMFVDNQKIWFLEFNPYGVYAASRSALFRHQQILQLEKQIQLPKIKILQC